MKSRKINREYIKCFFLFFVAVFVAYSLFLRQTYNADLVSSYGKDVSGLFNVSLSKFDPINALIESVANGRYLWILSYIIQYVLYHIGVSQVSGQFVFQLLSFVALAASATVLYNVFQKIVPCKKEFLYLTIGLIVINPAFAEILSFTCFDFCVGFLMCTIAFRFFAEAKYVLSGLFLLLSLAFYQSFYADYLMLSTSYLFISAKGVIRKKDFITWMKAVAVDFISTALTLCISGGIALILGVVQKRGLSFAGPGVMLDRFLHIIPRYGLSILTGGGVLPVGLILVVIVALFVFMIYSFVAGRKWKSAVLFVVYLLFVGLLPMAVHFFEETPYVPPRVLTSAYGVVGMILLMTFCFVDTAILKKTAALAGVVYAVFVFVGVNAEISDISASNKLEVRMLQQMGKCISEYEKDSGNNIKNACIYHFGDEGVRVFDKTNLEYYGPYYYTSHIITGYEWSDVDAIRYFAGFDLDRRDMSEKEKSMLFPDYSIDEVGTFNPSRQLRFLGDTMYWITY